MMSLIKQIAPLVLLALLATSCFEDTGNYDYNYLGEIEVANLSDRDFSYMYESDIIIEPEVLTTISEEELEYVWLRNVNGLMYDTLCYEKNLNVKANFPTSNLEFRVIHTPSDTHHRFTITVRVAMPFDQGWAILRNTTGGARLDFASTVEKDQLGSTVWKYYPSIFETINTEMLQSNPKGLRYSYVEKNWIVQYEDEGYFLDHSTMEKKGLISDLCESSEYIQAPYQFDYYDLATEMTTDQVRLLCTGGDLYAALGVVPEVPYGFRAPISGDHYIKDKVTRVSSEKQFLFFDENKRRFMYTILTSSKSESKPIIKVDISPDNMGIDLDNPQMDCLFLSLGGRTYAEGFVFAIMKNDADEYYMLTMDTDNAGGGIDSNPYDLRLRKVNKINASVINENTRFFLPKKSKNLFIINDNSISLFVGQSAVVMENWHTSNEKIQAVYATLSEMAIAYEAADSSLIEVSTFPKKELKKALKVEGEVIDMRLREFIN